MVLRCLRNTISFGITLDHLVPGEDDDGNRVDAADIESSEKDGDGDGS